MSNADVLKQLRKWLRIPGNTYPKLAVAMDYTSDAAPRMWVSRKKIPPREVQKLLSVISN